jgi:hypothetical protein
MRSRIVMGTNARRRFNMTNEQLAARLSSIVSELERMGENDMGDLPEPVASFYHEAVDVLRAVQGAIAYVAAKPLDWEEERRAAALDDTH